ncbi:MAG: malonyl-ACP O-methyltransferase BioC [Nitrospinales bacterium]
MSITPQSMTEQFDKRRISQHFSISAPNYDSASVVQRGAADELLSMAKGLALPPKRIIDIGCGTGYASRKLKNIFPDSYIISLDLAEGMLHQAKKCFDVGQSFNGVRGDVEFLPFKNNSTDLIFTNATLQLCNQIEQTMDGMQRVLKSGGTFLGTTFGPATLKQIYRAWEVVDPGNIAEHRFNFHPTTYWDSIFSAGDWESHSLEVKTQTQYYPTAMEALNSIRMAGVKNSLNARKKSLTGRKIFFKFVDDLENQRESKGIPLTYEIIFFQANKV